MIEAGEYVKDYDENVNRKTIKAGEQTEGYTKNINRTTIKIQTIEMKGCVMTVYERKISMNPYVQYMYSYPHKTAYRPLHGVHLKDYAAYLAGGGHGMYLHVPFCQAKCGYCNLFSVTGQGQKSVERYLDAVERQSSQYSQVFHGEGTQFQELVIGGGTPLFLTLNQLERVFAVVLKYFHFSTERDIVIETAPNQTEEEKLALLVQAGVTRVSMGIQSFCDRELAALGRFHSADRAREALALLKAAGFSCINVDFIYGIPGQTADSLLESLKEAVNSLPDEIFLYPLYVKHGVRMEHAGIVPDEKEAQKQYYAAVEFLTKQGYRQDSMRRFVLAKQGYGQDSMRHFVPAKQGYGQDSMRHFVPAEQRYGQESMRRSVPAAGKRDYSECGFGTSIALGCGGRSYLGNLHFCSPYAVDQRTCLAYLDEYEKTEDYTDITYGILLSQEELKRRYVIRHLMIMPGLWLERYQEHFGSQAADDFPILEDWVRKGYAEVERYTDTNGTGGQNEKKEFLALTESGTALSDYLGPQLISEKIRRAMHEWEEMYGQAHGFVPGQFEKL